MEFQKIINFIDTTDIKVYQRLLQKNALKFMINQKEITILIKKLGLKHQY